MRAWPGAWVAGVVAMGLVACGGQAAVPLVPAGGACLQDTECQTGFCEGSACGVVSANPAAGRVCEGPLDCRGLRCDPEVRRCVACGVGGRPACPAVPDAGPGDTDLVGPPDLPGDTASDQPTSDTDAGDAGDAQGDEGAGDGGGSDGIADQVEPDQAPDGPDSGDARDGGSDLVSDGVVDALDTVTVDAVSTLGVFVSGPAGDDLNPGTRDLPVATVAAGLRQAVQLQNQGLGPVSVLVAAAHYSEKVILIEGISLLGGHDCSQLPCSWTRAPLTFDTVLQAVDFEGVLAPATLTRATRLDGFHIVGLDGSPATDPGSAAVTLLGSPTVSGNRIFGGAVSGGASLPARQSVGLVVTGPSLSPGALISGNLIQAGTSVDISTALHFRNPGGAVAGAIAEVRGNDLRGGVARVTATVRAFGSGAATLLAGNDIVAASSQAGQSWGIEVGGQMTIDANRINLPGSGAGTCTGLPASSWCGGINSDSATTVITNNVIFGMTSPRSAAVRLGEFEVPAGRAVLNGNYLHGGGGPAPGGQTSGVSAAVVLSIGSCNGCGFNGRVGRVRNNLLDGGRNQKRYSLFEDAPAQKTIHPEALEANSLFTPSSGPGSALLYRFFDGSTATDENSIDTVNAYPFATGLLLNFDDDCQLNPVSFLLPAGSACIDAGTMAEAPAADRSGGIRPLGPAIDVGPDERR